MATAALARTRALPPLPESPLGRAAARRRVLLAVAGLSPQIITETLYALAQQKAPLPTEVHVLTTTTGAERVRLTLLSRTPGWFARLRRDCRLPAIRFGASQIHVVCDRNGRPLEDIRTPAENDLLADQIVALVREFTSDSGSALHVSLAGGRKTMGYYAGYALSLYGRPQDRLSHVLVSEKFESHPDFFYPPARPRIIYDRERRPLDASTAEVQLAEIPFVRLRERLSRPLLEGRLGFSATVAAMNAAGGPARLGFNLERHEITAGELTVPLPPRELAFYVWIAQRYCAGKPAACPERGTRDRLAGQQLLAIYQRLEGATARTFPVLERGLMHKTFSEIKSRLNHALTAAGVPEVYHIDRRRGKPTAFILGLPPAAISLTPEDLP